MAYLACVDGLQNLPILVRRSNSRRKARPRTRPPAQARIVLLVLDETPPVTERAANVKVQHSEHRGESADDEKHAV